MTEPAQDDAIDPQDDCSETQYGDFDDDDCYECGGEGYVYDCVSDYACIDPEGGCDLCMRRCPICNPRRKATDEVAA